MADPNWREPYNQVIYLLQGGGALGAYQVGICEGLLEHNCAPDWVIGTSIGGINAAIIAGNKPEDRIAKLKDFWRDIAVSVPDYFPEFMNDQMRAMQSMYISQFATAFGVSGFFTPRLINPWLQSDSTPDKISFYNTDELQKTLESVIDFKYLNSKQVRLTVSAICVETGNIIRFDNTKQELNVNHIMATGALPPGLPAIKIDDKYYWDGGLNSNTPFAVLMEEPLPRHVLCFVINLFSYVEKLPNNLAGVLKRKKDLEYISQHHTLLHYFCELQRFGQELDTVSRMVVDPAKKQALQKICESIHPTSLNIARFDFKDRAYDSWAKDFEFSVQSLQERFDLGYQDVQAAFKDPSWLELLPDAIQLHNF